MVMAKKEKPEPMKDREIVNLYAEGLSIDMLTSRVRYHDEVPKKVAREHVMEVIYKSQLKSKGGKI